MLHINFTLSVCYQIIIRMGSFGHKSTGTNTLALRAGYYIKNFFCKFYTFFWKNKIFLISLQRSRRSNR